MKPRVHRGDGAGGDADETSDLRRVKGRQSRDRIIDSALALFSEHGYAATGVNAIVRAAGIEKSALYWHFGSKEGLLAAVLDRMDAEFVERLIRRTVRGGVDPDERLDLWVGGLERLAAERGHLVRLMLSISLERSKVSKEARSAMERIYERTKAAVAHGFEQALGVKLPDADLVARLTLAYLWEAAVRAPIDPRGVDHKRFFAHLRRLIVLDVQHQLDAMGARVPASRLPRSAKPLRRSARR